MSSCVFCRIIAGELPAEILYSDGQATAFRDQHPVASTHVLIVPDEHIATINDLTEKDEPLIGHLFRVALEIARQEGIAETGYKLIANTGRGAGQTVFHLHLHLIGGRRMPHLFG
jgi:histidine triad (HIT) family protein